MADKLGVAMSGMLFPNQEKISVVTGNLVIAIWGVAAETGRGGEPELVLLRLVSDHFAENPFTGTNAQFADLETKWGE